MGQLIMPARPSFELWGAQPVLPWVLGAWLALCHPRPPCLPPAVGNGLAACQVSRRGFGVPRHLLWPVLWVCANRLTPIRALLDLSMCLPSREWRCYNDGSDDNTPNLCPQQGWCCQGLLTPSARVSELEGSITGVVRVPSSPLRSLLVAAVMDMLVTGMLQKAVQAQPM